MVNFINICKNFLISLIPLSPIYFWYNGGFSFNKSFECGIWTLFSIIAQITITHHIIKLLSTHNVIIDIISIPYLISGIVSDILLIPIVIIVIYRALKNIMEKY